MSTRIRVAPTALTFLLIQVHSLVWHSLVRVRSEGCLRPHSCLSKGELSSVRKQPPPGPVNANSLVYTLPRECVPCAKSGYRGATDVGLDNLCGMRAPHHGCMKLSFCLLPRVRGRHGGYKAGPNAWTECGYDNLVTLINPKAFSLLFPAELMVCGGSL